MFTERLLPLSDDYRGPIHMAVFQQFGVAILCLLMLDGGQLAKMCGLVMLGFWSGVALMMICRPLNPTPMDKLFIRFSFVPLFVACEVIARVMLR